MALRLLLIVVAFYTSRGVCLFASGPQIPAGGFGLEHISLVTVPLLFSACQNPVVVFLLPFVDLIMAGEDNRGKRAVEEISGEDMPMNQRLRRMR